MKNYKQILEAVNRGIQLALDDFDDEEQVQNIKSKLNNYRDYTNEYLDLVKDEAVDLGLPSGTLWCKYNLGVNPDQLINPEDWYGDYYTWGELKGNKPEFRWKNYKFGDYSKLTKYCNNSKFGLNGFTDNLTQLLPEDDAAYQNKKFLNFKFHIPTKDQCEELLKYTNNYNVNNYNPNKLVHNPEDDGGIFDLNGRIFEGKNGNQLFIPAAGYSNVNNTNYVGTDGFLWSSSLCLDNPTKVYNLVFFLNTINIVKNGRCCGFSIRPVINL